MGWSVTSVRICRWTSGKTVAEVLEVDAVIRAVDAIENGDVSEQLLTVVGDNWDIEQRARAQLDRLDLGDVALTRPLNTLSGGQVVSLGLAAQLLKQPDVLLLDEPTNNLDIVARRHLHEVIEDWKGCLLAVSHDRQLLDRMDQIAELRSDHVQYYGGNFADYEASYQLAREAAERTVRSDGAGGQAGTPGAATGARTSSKASEQRRSQPRQRWPAEDLRRHPEALCAGVGR